MSPCLPPPVQAEGVSFPVGGLFSLQVATTAAMTTNHDHEDTTINNNNGHMPEYAQSVEIPRGCCLKVSVATLQSSSSSVSTASTGVVTLHASSYEEEPTPPNNSVRVCSLSPQSGVWTISSLGLRVCGPRRLGFWATNESCGVIETTLPVVPMSVVHVVGSVVLDTTATELSRTYDDVTAVTTTKTNVANDDSTAMMMVDTDTCDTTANNNTHANANAFSIRLAAAATTSDDSDTDATSPAQRKKRRIDIVKETRAAKKEERQQAKQARLDARRSRKRQSKQKEVELREAVAAQQGYDTNTSTNTNTNDNVATTSLPSPSKKKPSPKNKNKPSPFSQRRLPCGVLIQDVFVGAGNLIKVGKKASVSYQGTLVPSGKVFDKNNNKNAPLQFRLGTGQVIRGLERGIEGMRVGGQRTIVVPPAMGYGNKGAGNVIPANATLEFAVELLGVGPYKPS